MPDRVNGHYGQATLVPRPSELLCGVAAGHGAMTALEEDRWSTCCSSGHGRGFVFLAVCLTCRTLEPDPRCLVSDRTLPDYKGTGGPSLPLSRVSLFSVRSRLRIFKNRAS